MNFTKNTIYTTYNLSLIHIYGYEMASLYNNISQIYQEQEEHEKALESLDKALELIRCV